MRVQMQGQHLRFRLQDAEFRRLLGGGTVENRTVLPDGRRIVQRVSLAATAGWHADGSTWRIDVPDAEVRAYGTRLPTREGLHFALPVPGGTALDVQFDVDVRDRARTRGRSAD